LRSLQKLSIRALWQDLCKGPLGKISNDLCAKALYKLSERGLLSSPYPRRSLLARSVSEISAQALYRSSLGKISTGLYAMSLLQDLYKRSLGKISAQAPYRRSLAFEEISVQALYKTSFGKISVRDFLARSLYKISIRALCTRSPYKRSPRQDLCASSLQKTSSRSLRKISLTLKATRSDTSKVTRRLLERSRNEHRATRERSDPRKATRRLRERSQNSHRATARAIRHAQSDERVEREVRTTISCETSVKNGR